MTLRPSLTAGLPLSRLILYYKITNEERNKINKGYSSIIPLVHRLFIPILVFLVLFISTGCDLQPLSPGAPASLPTNETTIPSNLTIVRKDATPIHAPSGNDTYGAVPTSIFPSYEGWQTYTSSTLGLNVDYPPEWHVKEEVDGVYFISPEGAEIVFSLMNTINNNDEFMVGNRHCTSRTNYHDLTADYCVETVSFSLSAKIHLTQPDGSTKVVMMRTITRTVANIFEAMFESIRQ